MCLNECEMVRDGSDSGEYITDMLVEKMKGTIQGRRGGGERDAETKKTLNIQCCSFYFLCKNVHKACISPCFFHCVYICSKVL